MTEHDFTQPETDHWGNDVSGHGFDTGAGDMSKCSSCGSRDFVGLYAGTEDYTKENWEEFYGCDNCGASGTLRHHEDGTRQWTGKIESASEALQ